MRVRKAGRCFVFCAAACISAQSAAAQAPGTASRPPLAAAPESGFNLGAGIGIPYGGIAGVEAEVVPILPAKAEKLGRYASLSFGVGGVPSGVGFDFGANAYPLGREQGFQPRLFFRYGVVGNYDYGFGSERIMGMSLGAGLRRQLGATLGVEADVLYIAKVFDDVSNDELGSRFKVAAGLRWRPAPRARRSSVLPPATASQRADAELGMGMGLGIPFGGAGANLELSPRLPGVPTEIYDHTGVSIGVGVNTAGAGYSFGVRGYPLGKKTPLVPRIAGYYGVVALAEYSDGSSARIEGFALGAALLRHFGDRLTAEAESLYIFPDWGGSRLDSHFKISLGLHARLR